MLVPTVLLACGIVASVLHIAMDDVIAVVPRLRPHRATRQRAVRDLRPVAGHPYSAGDPLRAPDDRVLDRGLARRPGNRALRLTSGLMLGFAALGLLAFPFPMVTDEVLGANTIHTIIWGVLTPLLMLAGIGASAAAFGKAFRLYAILTLVALVACSVLAGILALRSTRAQPCAGSGSPSAGSSAPGCSG